VKNNMKTAALLAGLGVFPMIIAGAIGRSPGALTIGFVIGMAMVMGSYWFSASIALKAAKAQVIRPEDAPDLYGIVQRLAQRADLPMPRVAISPADQPNAFATGRGPRNAVVCVTRGLLQFMPPDELEGVLAHELTHVKNRDILTGSIAAGIATGITYAAQMAMFSAIFGGRDDDEGGNPIVMLAMMLLAPLAASMIQMAISRSREFEADAGAAKIIGSGEPLARALTRIEAYAKQTPMNINPAQAAAWIHNPLSNVPGRRKGGPDMAKLFSTHPPTDERIRRLHEFSSSSRY
jgi:heat shock protein HtpX